MSVHFQQAMVQAGSAVGQLPPIGCVHFVGIGGIGMSGIAEIMHNLGFKIQGSDAADSANVQRLMAMGIKVFIGHAAAHIEGADVVTISSAVGADNVELVAARAAKIAVVRRAEMLAELMRLKPCITIAGTHGKTTTTSLVAALFDSGGLSPTVINGGIINAYGTNARLGAGDWMVVEADESDGTFTYLPSTIAVVTNIDSEHLDYYGGFEALRDAFHTYVENIPFYGFAVMCGDHQAVRDLMASIGERRFITYGLGDDVDIRAVNIHDVRGTQHFDIELSASWRAFFALDDMEALAGLALPMAGRYNLCNALAAIAVALILHVPPSAIAHALSGFEGVNRRFTHIGDWHGVRIIDDYAHHPIEIAAVIDAARTMRKRQGRIVAIVQPHRYSRLRDMRAEFCDALLGADIIGLLPVYAAGEVAIEGVDTPHLVKDLQAQKHRATYLIDSAAALAGFIAKYTQRDDIVLCMGAGSISRFARDLPHQLKEYAA